MVFRRRETLGTTAQLKKKVVKGVFDEKMTSASEMIFKLLKEEDFKFDPITQFSPPENLEEAVDLVSVFTLRNESIDRKIKVTLGKNSIKLQGFGEAGRIDKKVEMF